MATNMVWRVIYQFISSTTKKAAWDGPQTATVIAADSKEDTIKSVLTTNNIARPGAVIDIISVSRAGVPGGGENVLS